jgi:hypothetical protein
MYLLMQAQSNPDDDWMDYNNELRIGILDAYSGIFQGLGSGEMQPHLQSQHEPASWTVAIQSAGVLFGHLGAFCVPLYVWSFEVDLILVRVLHLA